MTDKIMQALYKKAVGYTTKEVVEEYAGESCDERVRKKVTIKRVPP